MPIAQENPFSQSRQKRARFGNRHTPASSPGSKDIPRSSSRPLAGLTFVVSGVGQCLNQPEVELYIVQHGGCVRQSVTRTTTHLLRGHDAGAVKTKMAEDYGVKIVDEDELFRMVANPPPS
eukprot:c11734_g1_i2.p1 GENE.c11734_g1_i2~~c11734_g1_i2.p1  ORF type:complete len:121 (+),score=24.87 c11734_g1_i2:162-524(+)